MIKKIHHERPSSSRSLSGSPLLRGVLLGFALGMVSAQIAFGPPELSSHANAGCNCNCDNLPTTGNTAKPPAQVVVAPDRGGSSEADIERGLIQPFERTPPREYLPGKPTDTYTYFHNYMNKLGQLSLDAPSDFGSLPLLHIWPRYFEAYHNHWSRYRGKDNVVFMEIGVQSGGKIPLLRDYFGPGLTYIGIEINPSCKMFESADWIHIEIGDSGNRDFLKSVLQKYPQIDIFLDDGGHFMTQQRLSMEMVLPHLQDDGVFMCEDLSTSWHASFGGVPWGDLTNPAFRDTSMMGLVHRSLEWLHSGWMGGSLMEFDLNNPNLNEKWRDTLWWRDFVKTVKHIHIYNQLVVYEKGLVEIPYHTMTVGKSIPYADSGQHEKVQWGPILARIQNITKSTWTTRSRHRYPTIQ